MLSCLIAGSGAALAGTHPIDAALEKCRQKNQDTASRNQCTTQALKQWDQELNKAYTSLMAALPAPSQEPLRAAEREWINYRDAEIKFLNARFASEQGTLWPSVEAGQILDLTRKRAIQLRCFAKMTDMAAPPDDNCP